MNNYEGMVQTISKEIMMVKISNSDEIINYCKKSQNSDSFYFQSYRGKT